MTSTVRAINFQHPSSTAANMTLASDGTVTGGIPSPNRNLLYNGAMQVAQRGTSTASITTSGYYTADRWQISLDSLGTWTQSVENDAPTGSGFRKSLKMLCTTADASPAAGDYLTIRQSLEGQDLQRIAKGTASAQQLTLSFWVKSNVTGTYTVMVFDNDNTRMTSFAYTISASGTWEKKSILIPADTTGAFDNDNALSLIVDFNLAMGSNFTSGSLAGSWATYTAANRAVGQTNLAAATNNYWQITGVQLETGSVATSFEFKSFGQELRECQRYYEKSFPYATAPASALANEGSNQSSATKATTGANQLIPSIYFKVAKRAQPSAVTTYAPTVAGAQAYDVGAGATSSTALYIASDTNLSFTFTGNAGGAIGNIIQLHWTASAEL